MGSGASERHYYELGEVRDAIARQAKSRWWRKNWNSWKPLNFMQRAVETGHQCSLAIRVWKPWSPAPRGSMSECEQSDGILHLSTSEVVTATWEETEKEITEGEYVLPLAALPPRGLCSSW